MGEGCYVSHGTSNIIYTWAAVALTWVLLVNFLCQPRACLIDRKCLSISLFFSFTTKFSVSGDRIGKGVGGEKRGINEKQVLGRENVT